ADFGGSNWDNLAEMAAASTPPFSPRAVFDHHLAKVYRRALRACTRLDRTSPLSAAAMSSFAELPQSIYAPDDSPMNMLARRLGMASEQCDLVWSVVACSFDRYLVPHIEALGGGHARRGLSLAVYAMIAEVDRECI